jgi:molecular chaperone Hsp33
VPIVSGEIGEDLAYYLAKSEQINSAVSLGVLMTVASDGRRPLESAVPEFALDRLRVTAAGGFIIQMMPSAEEGLIAHLERAIQASPNSTEMVRAGLAPADMLRTVLGDMDLTVLEEQEPRFHCPCSRERARLMISALGRDEVEDMIAKDEGAELICHFCNEAYRLTSGELNEILKEE